MTGVPPREPFVVVQPFGPVVEPVAARLKFSEGRATGRIIFDEAFKSTVCPEQTEDLLDETETTGAGTTTTDTVEVTEQPPVVKVYR